MIVSDTPSTPAPNAARQALTKVLSINELTSCYGPIQVLNGISMEVQQGQLVAIVGANGAGKTTLLRTLCGVQPISGGVIEFLGVPIQTMPTHQRVAMGMAHSPEGRMVFAPLSIEDNLMLGAYAQSAKYAKDDLEKIYTLFPILQEKRRLPAGTLSGGQQQMLAIGRALMARPKLLLLDEPSMGLAPLLVQEVFAVIQKLKEQGMTIVLVEQNALSALSIADYGYVLETGAITLADTGKALINNPQVRVAYLGM